MALAWFSRTAGSPEASIAAMSAERTGVATSTPSTWRAASRSRPSATSPEAELSTMRVIPRAPAAISTSWARAAKRALSRVGTMMPSISL